MISVGSVVQVYPGPSYIVMTVFLLLLWEKVAEGRMRGRCVRLVKQAPSPLALSHEGRGGVG